MHVEQFLHPEMEGVKSINPKSVYIITFQDGQTIKDKITRICDSFTGQRYDLPETADLYTQIERMKQTIENQRLVYENTKMQLRQQLIDFDRIEGNLQAQQVEGRKPSSTIYVYKMFLAKEKALYQTLNMMKSQSNSFLGYYWAPQEYFPKIQNALNSQTATKTVAYDNHNIMPPTFFKTTDLTRMWQTIVDTYGIPTYQEANPATISMVTFPFMFGLMFGDMGHGSIILAFGLFLTLFADSLKKTALKPFVAGRYLLLFMGICSTYCGFIYNEFFALPMQIFPSCYDLKQRYQWVSPDNNNLDFPAVVGNDFEWVYLKNEKMSNCTYPMGVDPVWSLSDQKITFSNGIKMKMSVIMGVLHMQMGIFIKGTNSIYHGRWADLFTEVIAGTIILLGLFGWMDFLIFAKWFLPMDIQTNAGTTTNQNAPSIIGILINTVFNMGAIPADQTTYVPLVGATQEKMYNIALILLLVVIVLIPCMLYCKPCFFRHKASHVEHHGEVEFSNIVGEENQYNSKIQREEDQNMD